MAKLLAFLSIFAESPFIKPLIMFKPFHGFSSKPALLLFFALGLQQSGFSQEVCGFDALLSELQQEPEYRSARAQADSLLFGPALSGESVQQVVHTVPVVFHIIYADGSDNISEAQILDQMRILNLDFRRLNSDASNLRGIFQAVAADPEIEFRLATIDPQGNCTNGINRVQSALSIDASDNVKSLISWNNTKYLNIWVVRSIDISITTGTVLGYAYPPSVNQPASLDGIVIRHDRVGSIGSAVPESLGRTLTHEVGHYFGLRHPFQGGCTGGDQVADTPPVALASNGCSLGTNSCSNDSPDLPDMLENYMDYSDEDCQNTFTVGQKTVMKNSIAQFALRGDVVAGANLTATGLSGQVCIPSPRIAQNRTVVCAGGAVAFEASAIGGNQATYSWSFPGGSPSSSTSANPLVTYSTPGVYDVVLVASNAAGSSQSTRSGAVRVSQSSLPAAALISGGFDQGLIPNAEWTVHSYQDVWPYELQSIGYNQSGGLRIRCFMTTNGQVDDLISQPVNLSLYTQAELRFQYAFQKRVAQGLSTLRVFVSSDCGQSWNTLRVIGGNQLSTNTTLNGTSEYAPAESEWRQAVIDLGTWAGSSVPLSFRFEFTAEGANNFYLDQIEIAGILSSPELKGAAFSVYPNPFDGSSFWISPESPVSEPVEIMVFDPLGRQMLSLPLSGASPWRVEMPFEMPVGVYPIILRTSSGTHALRLLVE